MSRLVGLLFIIVGAMAQTPEEVRMPEVSDETIAICNFSTKDVPTFTRVFLCIITLATLVTAICSTVCAYLMRRQLHPFRMPEGITDLLPHLEEGHPYRSPIIKHGQSKNNKDVIEV